MDHLDEVIQMLDSMADAGISRMKVETSETVLEGMTEKTYHHGRCDVGSPFATGRLYDLEAPDAETRDHEAGNHETEDHGK